MSQRKSREVERGIAKIDETELYLFNQNHQSVYCLLDTWRETSSSKVSPVREGCPGSCCFSPGISKRGQRGAKSDVSIFSSTLQHYMQVIKISFYWSPEDKAV
jgi:hypothetical protein